MIDQKFLTQIVSEICNYAVENGMEPDDTLGTVADNIKALLEISTFNNWRPKAKDDNDGWFSVKTLLPEEDCDVLVYNGLGLEIAAYTTNPVPKWYGWDGHQVHAMFWRFLPGLPKEVIEDD